MKKVRITIANQYIAATLFTPPQKDKPRPAVLFFHGMTSSEKNYIPVAQKLQHRSIMLI